jgi:hypothetical protein
MHVSSLRHDPDSMPARFHPHILHAGRGYRAAMHLAKPPIGVL